MAPSSSNSESNTNDTQVTKRPEVHPPVRSQPRQRRVEEHEYRASGSYQASFSLNIFSAFSGLFTSKRSKTTTGEGDKDGQDGHSSDEDSDGDVTEQRRVAGVRRSELTTSSVARTETAQRHRVIVEDLPDNQEGAGRKAVGPGKERLAIKE